MNRRSFLGTIGLVTALRSSLEAQGPLDRRDVGDALATAEAGAVFGFPVVTPVGERDVLIVADRNDAPVTVFAVAGTPVRMVRVRKEEQ